MRRPSLLAAALCAGALLGAATSPAAAQGFSLSRCLAKSSQPSRMVECFNQERARGARERERQAAEWQQHRRAEEDAARQQAEEAGREVERVRQAGEAARRLRDAEAQRQAERARQEETARGEAEGEARQAAERARRALEAQRRAAEGVMPGGCVGPVPTRDCAMSGDPIADQIRKAQEAAARRHGAR